MWIEIKTFRVLPIGYLVTSLAEVWIEILPLHQEQDRGQSLPLRKCGLKWFLMSCFSGISSRHFPCGSVDWNLTLPLSDRSSQGVTSLAEVWIEILQIVNGSQGMKVTSLAEVWIEIYIYCDSTFPWHGHFPCGSVDWNTTACWRDSTPDTSLPLRKCGLKSKGRRNPERNQGHFPCGSVDWNKSGLGDAKWDYRHFPCGSVDWNYVLLC